MHINTMSRSAKRDVAVLNVGGVIHKTRWDTLEKLPGTRLAILAKLREGDESYNPDEKEYYFDRNPQAFNCIIDYYRTLELHICEGICGNAMKQELDYWGIFESEIEACCWGTYSKYLDHRETLANLDSTFRQTPIEDQHSKQLSCLKRFQLNVWNNLEYPSTSRGAKVLMFISITVVLVSILSFIFETYYPLQVLRNNITEPAPDPEPYYYYIYQKGSTCLNRDINLGPYPDTIPIPALTYIDYSCFAFFSMEFIIRFIFAPDKCKFMKSLLNIVDLVCVITQGVSITLEHLNNMIDLGEHAVTASDILKVVRILRTIRVLRVFKLMKHYSAFKVLAYTIQVSTKELLLMVVFLLSGVLIFASIIHFVEKENFTSIPYGIWWALVTMTTVGYGDKVPITTAGYVIGCVCVMSGVLVIAFTVPIVVNNFTLYYSHANSRAKLPLKKKVVRKTIKLKPKMVAVSPTFNALAERADTPCSAHTCDDNMTPGYTNNFNIKADPANKTKASKFSFTEPILASTSDLESTLTSTKVKNNHELEAKALVSNLQERDRHMMNEKRRQYMLAFKKIEEKRKGQAKNKKM